MALEGQQCVVKDQEPSKRGEGFILVIDSVELAQLSCATQDIPLVGTWLASDVFHFGTKCCSNSAEAGLVHPRKSFSLSELARQQDAQLMRKWLSDHKQESGVFVLINQVDRKGAKGGSRAAVPLLFDGDAFLEGKLHVIITPGDDSLQNPLDVLEIRKQCAKFGREESTTTKQENNTIISEAKDNKTAQSSSLNINGELTPRRSISFEKAKEAFNCKVAAATTTTDQQIDERRKLVPPPLPAYRPNLKQGKEIYLKKRIFNGIDDQVKKSTSWNGSTTKETTLSGKNEAKNAPPPPRPPKPTDSLIKSVGLASSSSLTAMNGARANVTTTTTLPMPPPPPPPPPPPIKEKATIRYGYLRKPDKVGFWVARLVVFDSRQNSLIHACFNRAGALMPPEHIYFRRLTRVQLSIYSPRQFEIDEDESLDVRFDLGQRVSPNRKDFVTIHRFLCDDEEDAQEWVALIHSACPELRDSSPPPARPPKPSSSSTLVKNRSLSSPPIVGVNNHNLSPVQQQAPKNAPSIPPRPKLTVNDGRQNSIVSTMKRNFEKQQQQPSTHSEEVTRKNSTEEESTTTRTLETSPHQGSKRRENSVRFVDQHGKVIPPPPPPAMPDASQHSRHALSQDGKLVPPPPPPPPPLSSSNSNNSIHSGRSLSFSSTSSSTLVGNGGAFPPSARRSNAVVLTSTPAVSNRNQLGPNQGVGGKPAAPLPPQAAPRSASSLNGGSNGSSSVTGNGSDLVRPASATSVGKPAPPPPPKTNHFNLNGTSPPSTTTTITSANGSASTAVPPPIPVRRYSESPPPPRMVSSSASSSSSPSLMMKPTQQNVDSSFQPRRRRSRADEDDWARLRAIHQAEVTTNQKMKEVPVWMLPRSSRPRDPPPPPARTTRPGFYNGIQSLN